MRSSFGKGYLGEIGQRLQRLLGFDGEADASFTSEARPVIIVGDATLPGYGNQQGRRFAIASAQLQGASTLNWFIKADQDVIIEQIQITRDNTAAALGSIRMYFAPPTIAEPVTLAVAGLFLDRAVNVTDRPQMRGAVSATLSTGSVQLLRIALPAAYGAHIDPHTGPFLLAAGCALEFSCTVDCFVTLFGRTL